jgi:hypothetical protein
VSLLLLFQGGSLGVDIPPPTPVIVAPIAFLPHGTGVIGPGATPGIGTAAGVAVVEPGPSTAIDGGHAGIIGPGGTTTIQ